MSASRVVVCEDDPSTTLLLRKGIGSISKEIEIVTCENVGQALLALQAKPADLLILDHMMAGVHGLDGLRHIRKTEWGKQLPVILYSAADIEAEAMASGATRFVRKPVPITELRNIVKEILDL